MELVGKCFQLDSVYHHIFQAYLVGANFGATVTEINGTVALPERYVSINAQVLIVTDNVDHKNYKPRQKIPSLDKVSLGPRQGILIKVDFRVE